MNESTKEEREAASLLSFAKDCAIGVAKLGKAIAEANRKAKQGQREPKGETKCTCTD